MLLLVIGQLPCKASPFPIWEHLASPQPEAHTCFPVGKLPTCSPAQAKLSLLNLVFPPLIHRPNSFTPLNTALWNFTAKQMFYLIHKLPGTQPEKEERGPRGVLKEVAACNGLPGPEITPWISPSVPLFASQAQVCSFLPRDPFLSPINTITAL